MSNETATPQTNFSLYNIGSEMLWDRATAILSETPCSKTVDLTEKLLNPLRVFDDYVRMYRVENR